MQKWEERQDIRREMSLESLRRGKGKSRRDKRWLYFCFCPFTIRHIDFTGLHGALGLGAIELPFILYALYIIIGRRLWSVHIARELSSRRGHELDDAR
jgi:hypothetical protein